MEFGFVIGLLVLGAAVKQMAYILLHGSIFEPLRDAIKRRAKTGSKLFSKINELFTCKVCMSTQLGLWTVGLPTILSSLHWHFLRGLISPTITLLPEILLSGLAGWMLAMATAAVALTIWEVAHLPSTKFEAMKAEYEKKLETQRKAFAAALANQTQPPIMTMTEFTIIVQCVDEASANIGCGYTRRQTRATESERLLKEWWGAGSDQISGHFYNLLGAMAVGLRAYYQNAHTITSPEELQAKAWNAVEKELNPKKKLIPA